MQLIEIKYLTFNELHFSHWETIISVIILWGKNKRLGFPCHTQQPEGFLEESKLLGISTYVLGNKECP